MSGDMSLFGDDEPDELPTAPAPTPTLAAPWQIDLLRKALDNRRLTTMDERKAAIEEVIGRPVESLRALTHEEALQAITKLGQPAGSTTSVASAWDDRDEDTWIDRL